MNILDQFGLQLEGMHQNLENVDDTDEVIVHALNDLTRVAPYLEAAVDGEQREPGRHFVHDYRRILDDAEHGFYWVLCQLHRLRATIVDGGDTARTASVTNVVLPEANSRAIQHYRDYIALRDFGRLLDKYRHLLWHRRARTDRRSRASRDASDV